MNPKASSCRGTMYKGKVGRPVLIKSTRVVRSGLSLFGCDILQKSQPTLTILPLSRNRVSAPSATMASSSIARVLSRRMILISSCCSQLTSLIEIHISARRHALTKFSMPAMSPTMTEGGIASWKKAEGETFAAGDVLLEIVRSPNLVLASVPFLMSVYRKRTRLPST